MKPVIAEIYDILTKEYVLCYRHPVLVKVIRKGNIKDYWYKTKGFCFFYSEFLTTCIGSFLLKPAGSLNAQTTNHQKMLV